MLEEIEYLLNTDAYSSKLCRTTTTLLFHIISGGKEEHLRKKAKYAVKQEGNITVQMLSYEKLIDVIKNPYVTHIERTG